MEETRLNGPRRLYYWGYVVIPKGPVSSMKMNSSTSLALSSVAITLLAPKGLVVRINAFQDGLQALYGRLLSRCFRPN
jgi:hypothetical protein